MKISVAGASMTKFGEIWDKTLEDLAIEAALGAIEDANSKTSDLDAVFVGNMLYEKLDNQGHLGSVITSSLKINAPALRVEGACASGGLAVHLAIQALLAKTYKKVLVLGVEKMTDYQASDVAGALMAAGSEEERQAGLTFPGLYALMAKAHMREFGTTINQLACVSEKNHYHASLNDKAQFPFQVTIDKVLSSTPIASPFTLLDSSPLSDGAAALVLTSDDLKGAVKITGSSVATDTIGLHQRETLTEIKATKLASNLAYKQSGVTPKDVDVAEVHDCFTIAEILAMEDLGFCKKGEGGEFIEQGHTKLGGKLPINTSGGLKACGHPVGATGVKQIVEITEQLLGKSGKRQVDNPKVGLAQNVGGTGATVVVHILQK